MMESVNYAANGVVFDVQRFSIHDGPGIRTIVFLKGCPLSCLWCCNPESQEMKPTIMFKADACIHCGRCLTVCKHDAIGAGREGLVDRAKCMGCGECANVCPVGALVLKGKTVSVTHLIEELKKDAITFRRSGGGITFSGGEPLVQREFLLEALKACKSQGWHTAIETTGYAPAKVIEEIFPWVDLVLLDIKCIDDAKHKKNTGVSNDLILKNSILLSQISPTVVRVPTIPNVNASRDEFSAICAHARRMHGVETIHILPYHTYGENKYELLGKKYAMTDVRSLVKEEIGELERIVEDAGFKCVIGG